MGPRNPRACLCCTLRAPTCHVNLWEHTDPRFTRYEIAVSLLNLIHVLCLRAHIRNTHHALYLLNLCRFHLLSETLPLPKQDVDVLKKRRG